MQQTSKAYFLQLTILHGALMAAQLMFGAVVYYVNSTESLTSPGSGYLDAIFQYIVPVFILVSYLGSSFLSKMQLKPLKAKTDLIDKLVGYRAVLITRYALLEVPALFSLVCFTITGNYFYLGLAALIIIVFLLNRPTPDRAVNDLELSPADRVTLENPDALVL